MRDEKQLPLDGTETNRRELLKGVTAAGTTSVFGVTTALGAPPEETSVDIDDLLLADKIATLKREIPGLELYSEKARVLGGEEGIVAIPANYGTLLTYPPEGSVPDSLRPWIEAGIDVGVERPTVDAASFYFTEWVPGVDADWVEGTNARLRVSDGGTTLTRTATQAEAEQFLSSLDAPELDPEEAIVGVEPETGTVTVTQVNTEDERFDRVQAEPAGVQTAAADSGLAAAKAGLEVTDRHSEQFAPEGIETQGFCNADDVIFCVINAVSCWPCAVAVGGGPKVFAACMIFVCLGFPAQPIAEIMADIGCANVAGCTIDEITDIISDLLDKYEDDIPIV